MFFSVPHECLCQLDNRCSVCLDKHLIHSTNDTGMLRHHTVGLTISLSIMEYANMVPTTSVGTGVFLFPLGDLLSVCLVTCSAADYQNEAEVDDALAEAMDLSRGRICSSQPR